MSFWWHRWHGALLFRWFANDFVVRFFRIAHCVFYSFVSPFGGLELRRKEICDLTAISQQIVASWHIQVYIKLTVIVEYPILDSVAQWLDMCRRGQVV